MISKGLRAVAVLGEGKEFTRQCARFARRSHISIAESLGPQNFLFLSHMKASREMSTGKESSELRFQGGSRQLASRKTVFPETVQLILLNHRALN